MATNLPSIPSWAQNAAIYGSNDSFLLLDIFPKDVADDLFYNLKDEIKWNQGCQIQILEIRDFS